MASIKRLLVSLSLFCLCSFISVRKEVKNGKENQIFSSVREFFNENSSKSWSILACLNLANLFTSFKLARLLLVCFFLACLSWMSRSIALSRPPNVKGDRYDGWLDYQYIFPAAMTRAWCGDTFVDQFLRIVFRECFGIPWPSFRLSCYSESTGIWQAFLYLPVAHRDRYLAWLLSI